MKIILVFTLILLLCSSLAPVFGATVAETEATMTDVRNEEANISFGQYGKFNKKRTDINLENKTIDITLTVENDYVPPTPENKNANIVFLMDASGSMTASDSSHWVTINGVDYTRQGAMFLEANKLADKLLDNSSNVAIAVADFATAWDYTQQGIAESDARVITSTFTNSKTAITNAFNEVKTMQKAMLLGNRVADAGKMAQALGQNHNKTEIIVYTDKMHNDVSWGNYIKAYVETAINNDEFVVYLQPKFDIQKEVIKGAEALIRWNYKNKEFLSPARFIPFFEKDGSIGKIDDIVLEKVCAALARWKKEGKPLYPISVNLSRNRLYDKDLISHLTEVVDSYGVAHELIDFELTESAGYDNTDHMISVLEELRSAGFKISMDDFGTGYSSLSLLTQMPLDTLKIDKSFVDNVSTPKEKEEDIIVLRHIISLAKELGFICLAEGAESNPQVDRLRKLGCEVIQGYYYSKPIPMNEYEEKYLGK